MAVILFAPQISTEFYMLSEHPSAPSEGGEGDVAGNGLQNILCETLCPPW